MTTQVYANSSLARFVIYSCDTVILICSVPQLTCKNPFVEISSWNKVLSLAEYFCLPLLVWIFPNMAKS